ncbi:MAG: esterase-like activity of phytase family protein [Bryobacteraceae bacterium]
MKILTRTLFTALTLASPALWAADAGVTFIGRGEIPGNIADKSGLTGQICQNPADGSACIDKTTFGGFGSALTYTGYGNVFLAVPDRGPFDGRTNLPYLDRFHFLRMTVDTNILPSSGTLNINWKLLDTDFLTNEARQNLVGDSSAFNTTNPLRNLRFDPEGVAISREGTFFVSDEYGPFIYEFSRSGRLIRRIPVPAKFLIANPSGDLDGSGNSLELYPANNISGRQANRGMEGLTITPNGRYLIGIMQNALIQDHGLNSNTPPGRVGMNNRILKYDLRTRKTQEYVYTMDAVNQGRGVNEILAVNDHEFLVLERDNRTNLAGSSPNLKRIYKIDLEESGLTDVSNVASLPQLGTELAAANIKAVTKTKFIDLLDAAYKVSATQTIKDVIAEKMEGLAWGRNRNNGHYVLFVVSDNDLNTTLATQIYAFDIDPATASIQRRAQYLPEPLYRGGDGDDWHRDSDDWDRDNDDRDR